jgi:phage baseplate assembly protein W
MAFRIANKNPLEINGKTAIGVAIPFNVDDVFRSTYTTVDQVKSNIINFILTNKREKLFQPNYGADLRRMIFENIDINTLKTLEVKLTNDIQDTFPNVEIQSLVFSLPTYQDYALELNIAYSFFNNPSQNIQIIF